MAGPWEDYQAGGAVTTIEPSADGPWSEFQQQPPERPPWEAFAAPPTSAVQIPQDVIENSNPEQYATPDKIPPWTEHAAEAAVETFKGFIPKSGLDVAKLLTPLASLADLLEEARKNVTAVREMIAGNKS